MNSESIASHVLVKSGVVHYKPTKILSKVRTACRGIATCIYISPDIAIAIAMSLHAVAHMCSVHHVAIAIYRHSTSISNLVISNWLMILQHKKNCATKEAD